MVYKQFAVLKVMVHILFAMSSTKRKCTLYTMQFKLGVIIFAKENSNRAAEVQFSVSEKLVREFSVSQS